MLPFYNSIQNGTNSSKKFHQLLLGFFLQLHNTALFFQLFSLIFIKIELILAGDIHPNIGQFDNSLKLCHWNLNGVCVRDKIKIPLLEAYY